MNILCVDDERPALDLLTSCIKEVRPNENVYAFQFVDDALASINHDKMSYDIAFCDVEMNEINGVSLAQELKQLLPNIKLVFVTGYDNYAIKAYEMHIDGYILKPINKNKIKDNLDYLLPNKQLVEVRCFGNFDLLYQGKSIKFSRNKSKELLAFLIDRRGVAVSANECMAILYEDRCDRKTQKLFAMVVFDTKRNLKQLGINDLLENSYNSYSINTERVNCDYYNALNGSEKYKDTYMGEYMKQYEWADETNAELGNKFYV